MLESLATNGPLRLITLLLLFASVALISYLFAYRTALRSSTRRRLLDPAVVGFPTQTIGSLRSERVESAWLKLVNTIEKRGLSLVDTNDASLRQQMIAAGYMRPHAPRVYTLVRLVLVVALPTLVLLLMWLTGGTAATGAAVALAASSTSQIMRYVAP
jgi:tight adherence protein C